ncbi:MAG: 50S ribosomal protein L9 [Acetobacteraceae bacterium]|nr:50S ribosomal protein L9 [Acetobacteraceae bacterium]
MKVILTRDLPGKGVRDQVVTVADGYARNYLIPRGLAVEATPAALKRLAEERGRQRDSLERRARDSARMAAQLRGASVTIAGRAGADGRLFGSVTAMDVAAALREQAGLGVDRRRIELPEPIKRLGRYSVLVKLGHDQTAVVEVTVVPE